MIAVMTTLVGALGLAIGSFLNVVAYRVPNQLSVVRPASACPGCGSEIRGRDNVPVLSWLLLRGRCRDCSMHISARYPIVEAITGLAFVAVALVFAPAVVTAPTATAAVAAGLDLVAFCYFAAISVVLTAIDIDVRRLPNAIVYPSLAVELVLLGAATALRGEWATLGIMAISAIALPVFFFILAMAYPGGGMGMGDVKLAAVLGIVLGSLGWAQVAVGVFAGFLLGGVFGIVLMAVRRAGRRTRIPFGPWMLAGAWIGIFAGEPLADAYLSLVGLH